MFSFFVYGARHIIPTSRLASTGRNVCFSTRGLASLVKVLSYLLSITFQISFNNVSTLIGTYTYPISFSIPGDSPPSLQCEFGCVSYQLKATVHRPGTFTHKLTASHEVTLIASPGEDDLDESDNILVQREWDSQMHYMITISGRAFPIG